MSANDLRSKLSQYVHCERWWMREFFAEFLGTAFLVALGDGAVAQVVLSKQGLGTFLTINLAYALAITFGVYISGGISGGHINPAITLAMCILGKTKWIKLPIFWLAQYMGAFFGSICLFTVYNDAITNFDGGIRQVYGPNATAGIFATYPAEYVSTTSCFFDQVMGTSILSLCVLAITDSRNMEVPKSMVPILVGLTVGLVGMAYGLNCGFAINPARDFGPRLFTATAGWGLEVFSFRNFNWFWVPVIAPHLGAIVGAFLYESMIGLHWPECDTIVISSNGQIHSHNQNETDFNLTPMQQKGNAVNSHVNQGYNNNAMRVYVS